MKAAHADPHVAEVAVILEQHGPSNLFLFLRASLKTQSSDLLVTTLGRRLALPGPEAVRLMAIVQGWRNTLDSQALTCRLGAIVEQLVARLLRQTRFAPQDVHEETGVLLTSGDKSAPFDVLAAGAPPWEAYECKAGHEIPWKQGKELSFVARTANAKGDQLRVVIASPADRESLRRAITAEVSACDLIYFVAEDDLFSIATAPPSEHACPEERSAGPAR